MKPEYRQFYKQFIENISGSKDFLYARVGDLFEVINVEACGFYLLPHDPKMFENKMHYYGDILMLVKKKFAPYTNRHFANYFQFVDKKGNMFYFSIWEDSAIGDLQYLCHNLIKIKV